MLTQRTVTLTINAFWRAIAYVIMGHFLFAVIYMQSRIFGIYPLDLLKKETIEIRVTNVEGYPGFLDGDYHVYTDKGEFINRDSSLLGKFNSHDIQNYLFLTHDKRQEVDCDIEVAGYRIYGPGKLSFLPNIISIQCD